MFSEDKYNRSQPIKEFPPTEYEIYMIQQLAEDIQLIYSNPQIGKAYIEQKAGETIVLSKPEKRVYKVSTQLGLQEDKGQIRLSWDSNIPVEKVKKLTNVDAEEGEENTELKLNLLAEFGHTKTDLILITLPDSLKLDAFLTEVRQFYVKDVDFTGSGLGHIFIMYVKSVSILTRKPIILNTMKNSLNFYKKEGFEAFFRGNRISYEDLKKIFNKESKQENFNYDNFWYKDLVLKWDPENNIIKNENTQL